MGAGVEFKHIWTKVRSELEGESRTKDRDCPGSEGAQALNRDRSGLGPSLPLWQWEGWAERGARTLPSRQWDRRPPSRLTWSQSIRYDGKGQLHLKLKRPENVKKRWSKIVVHLVMNPEMGDHDIWWALNSRYHFRNRGNGIMSKWELILGRIKVCVKASN